MRLRPATPADLHVLRHWDEQPHVVDSDPNDDWGWEEELQRTPEWREQLIAEVDGRPIGFIQIIDPAREDSHYWGGIATDLRAIDIWIGEAADLGRGYGTTMMHLALARCFAAPDVAAVVIDPLESNGRRAALLRAAGIPLRRAAAVRRRRLLRVPARAGGLCRRHEVAVAERTRFLVVWTSEANLQRAEHLDGGSSEARPGCGGD